MKSDLSNVKVGQKIWTIQEGWTEVTEIDIENEIMYPIRIGNEWYSLDGKCYKNDNHPSAFLSNPFEKEITEADEDYILIGFNVWVGNEYDWDLQGLINKYLDQKYKPLPTAEEAAEKLGITVEQLKEIVK